MKINVICKGDVMKMGKIIMNLAVSLDGYIADNDGGYEWITGHGNKDLDTLYQYDYSKFLQDIDIVVMGKKSYEQGMAKDFPTKVVYVASNQVKEDIENIHFISSDIVSKILEEKNNGKNVYLFGGGILIDNFLKMDVIDEYIIGLIPTILGKGRPLFLGNNKEIKLHLDKYCISDGITILYYSRRR